MADKKISALSNATTPLTGAEQVPVVQSGTTVKTTVSDIRSGGVLQVVNATYSTQTLSTSSTYADTGLTASITPKFSTSKILVLVNQNGLSKKGTSSAFNALNMQLLRGTTVLAKIAGGYGYTGTLLENATGQCSTSYLDSPATTSSTTYKTQFAADQNVDGVLVQNNSSVSTITLLEIAA
jgi:hypothetical protein